MLRRVRPMFLTIRDMRDTKNKNNDHDKER